MITHMDNFIGTYVQRYADTFVRYREEKFCEFYSEFETEIFIYIGFCYILLNVIVTYPGNGTAGLLCASISVEQSRYIKL